MNTPITHVPINNFNSDQVNSFLTKGFSDVLAQASSSDPSVTLYKPTSGAWTSSKPTTSGTSGRVLNDLAKSLKALDNNSNNNNSTNGSRKHKGK